MRDADLAAELFANANMSHNHRRGSTLPDAKASLPRSNDRNLALDSRTQARHDLIFRRQRHVQTRELKWHRRAIRGLAPTLVVDSLDEVRTTVLTPRVAQERSSRLNNMEVNMEGGGAGVPPLGDAPLDIVQSWLQAFSKEEEGFDSLTVFFETRLREALVQTDNRNMPVPNRARAAMCCDLLVKIPRLFGRFSPLVTHLVREVLRCVYKDYSMIIKGSKIDAQFLFQEPAYFDIAEAMRRKAVRLQDELNELTEGTGLVKIFRDRFLLWDGRNLLLRCILFRGWLRYARTMANGRRRLRRLRMIYWLDRLWEGIEHEREERERLERAAAHAAALLSEKEERRRTRMTRRASTLIHENTHGLPFDETVQAADATLKFLGLASNRATLVQTIAIETEKKKETFVTEDFLVCLVNVMHEAGVTISPEVALLESFSRKIGLFPVFANKACGSFEEFLKNTIHHLPFLSFGAELDRGASAAFMPIRQWIEAQKPPFPTSVDLQWLQKKFGMRCDGTVLSIKTRSAGLDKSTQSEFGPTSSGKIYKSKGRQARQLLKGRIDAANEDEDLGRGGRGGAIDMEESFGIEGVRRVEKDKDVTSNVAVSTVCQLIPLLYDRLIDVCNGSLNEAYKVKVQELGKHALIRRFGIKSIAINYLNSLMRTVKLCTDRETRFKLFCTVFSIEPEKRTDIIRGHKKSGGLPSAIDCDSTKQLTRQEGSLKQLTRQEAERRQMAAGVIAIFCDIWHNYFNSLQVIEATKMQQERVNTRRRVREKSRVNRLSECKATPSSQTRYDSSLLPPSKLFEQFLRINKEPKLAPDPIEAIVSVLRKMPEFGGSRKGDIEKFAARLEIFSFPADQVMLRQGDSTTPAALIISLHGIASIYIRSCGQVISLLGTNKEDHGQLVKTLQSPFVVGEGRMLTGAPANASIVAGKNGINAAILRVKDWDDLMDENNTALRGLEVNAVQRAEERTKASGLSVNSEKISIYRSFFTDVDVNRTGRVNLSELLEAIQSKGTSVSMRDVEKAFKAADKDGDLELEFDEFIIMCDNLLRRGKRLFEQKRVSDVLIDLNRSLLLLESFQVAIERSFKHTASHEPHVYAELQLRIESLERERIDMSTFMQSSQSDKTKGAKIKKNLPDLLPCIRSDNQSKKPVGPGVTVINADEALSTAMEFWEVEHIAKGKLARIVSSRNIIGRLVSRWLKSVRQKAIDRQAWHNFLRHYLDQDQLHETLIGSVEYEAFIDLVERVYGLPINDTLGTALFSDFEDFADKIAATSEEAIEAGRFHLIKQVAALRAQLWYLRSRSRKEVGRNLKLNISRRSRMVILLYIVKNYIDGDLEGHKSACDLETNAKVAELLLSARTFEVNADAAFCALQARGICVGRRI